MLDPTLGDETARRLRDQLERGDWREAQEFLKGTRNWDDRAFYVRILAEWEGRPEWLDAWHATAGGASAVVSLVRGSHSIGWAWEARGSATAGKVDQKSWPAFTERLHAAERDLEAAARLDPEDPTPWALLLQSGLGLQLPRETLRSRFDEAQRRHRESRLAHYAYLGVLTWKWGGSHQEMLAFAREAGAAAPPGSSLHGLIAWAQIERWLGFAMENNASAHRDYLSSPAVKAEVLRAWERLIGARRLRSPRFEPADRNIFAFCFWKGGEHERARAELAALAGRVTKLPWGYAGDAEKTVARAIEECLGSGDPTLVDELSKLRDEAVRSARDNHRVTLDYSEASLAQVDVVLSQLQQALAAEKDDARGGKAAGRLAAAYGAYVGEVVRRRHGGTWERKVAGNEKGGYALLVGDRYGFPLLACAIAIRRERPEPITAYVRQWFAPGPAATGVHAAPPAAPPPPPGQVMLEFAEKAVADAAKLLGQSLDYTARTLPVVDQMLDRIRTTTMSLAPEVKREVANVTALKYGAYLGEVLRRVLGGVWREAPPPAPNVIPTLVVGSDSAMTVAAVLGLLEDRAVAMGEGKVSTAVEYFDLVCARRTQWLEQLLSGGTSREVLLTAMTDHRPLAETLYGLAASAVVTAWTKWDLHLDFSEASLEGLEDLLRLLLRNELSRQLSPIRPRPVMRRAIADSSESALWATHRSARMDRRG